MLNLKNLFRNIEFIKADRIQILICFPIPAFTYAKQIEEKRMKKKSKILQVIKRKIKHHSTCTSD